MRLERGHTPRSLVIWVGLAVVLMWMAPEPPAVPIYSEEEVAVWDRTSREAGENARAWQRDRGDLVIPWDEARGHLAIVIDDVGRELHVLEKLLALRHRLNFSVLPGSVYAMGAQLRVRADGRRYREVWMHLPMEPRDAEAMRVPAERDETFLLVTDDTTVLRRKVNEALDRVPVAVGVNNHMGSALTEDRAAMDAVMEVLSARGLAFLDSRTTERSTAFAAARAAGIPSISRHVFLDNDLDPKALERALREAAARSLNEPTVAIGHPSMALVEVLERTLPELHDAGIALYPLSEVIAQGRTFPASPKG